MGKLLYEFHRNRKKYVQIKHQFSTKSQREKLNRIKKFLQFCENKQVGKINDLWQKHYDQFIEILSNAQKSDETIRKYSLALKEFFQRAHLDVLINPNKAKKRRVSKKIEKIIKIINEYCDNDTANKIKTEI